MLASNIRTAACRYGTLSWYADDMYIGRSLEKYGEYSQAEVELWAKIVKPGDFVIDVGANIGALTLPLAQLVGEEGHVYAFEPQPQTCYLLINNVRQNSLDYVTVNEMALGARTAFAKIANLNMLDRPNYGGVELDRGGDYAVDVHTLDEAMTVIDDHPRIDFIKIDVEGHEAEVIKGASKLIDRCRPLLYVENDRQEKSAALLKLIHSLDYRVWQHLPPLYSPLNFRDDQENVFGEIVSINLLCIPKERVEQYRDVTHDLRPLVPHSPSLGKSQWAGVCRLGGIGDNLIAASVCRPLKSLGYKVEVITQEPQSVVFENNPFVDKLSVHKLGDLPVDWNEWLKWFSIRSKEYVKFANLSHTCEVSCAILPSQAQYQWPAAARRKYFGHNYLEFVMDVMGVPYEFGPLFFPTEEEKDHAQDTRRRLNARKVIGWCITGSRVDKIYNPAPIVIARLIRELDAHVVLLGAPPPAKDLELANQIVEWVQIHNGTTDGVVIALSTDPNNPHWPIRRLLTFAQGCDLVIGPDTGPMWAVAFEPVPKIMLHSHAGAQAITGHWANTVSLHANPDKVPCWPCCLLHDSTVTCQEEQRRHGLSPKNDDKGAACITSIGVEQVVMTAKRLLEAKP